MIIYSIKRTNNIIKSKQKQKEKQLLQCHFVVAKSNYDLMAQINY
jgi:hypothetical protein